jgi:hypothetical protein
LPPKSSLTRRTANALGIRQGVFFILGIVNSRCGESPKGADAFVRITEFAAALATAKNSRLLRAATRRPRVSLSTAHTWKRETVGTSPSAPSSAQSALQGPSSVLD